MPEVPLLGQNNTQHKAPPPAVEARIAFVVYTDNNGQTFVSPNINLPLIVDHQATPDEVIAALDSAVGNLHAQRIAAHVMQQFNMMGQAAMQAKMQQDMISKLNLEKK